MKNINLCQFEEIVRFAPIAVLIAKNQTIQYVNEYFVNMFMYKSSDEIINRKITKLLPPSLKDTIYKRSINREKGLNEPKSYEIKGLKSDKSIFPVLLHINTIKMNNEVTTIAFIEDITLRKQKDQQLIKSEDRYKSMFEQSPNAMVIINCNTGKFIDVNNEAKKLFSLSQEELLDTGPVDLSPEFQPDGSYSNQILLIKYSVALSGEISKFEHYFKDVNDKIIICTVNLVAFPSSDTEKLIMATFIDITQKMRSQIKLKISEQRYKTLVEHSTEAIIVYDHDNQLFIDSNKKMQLLIGKSADEINSMNLNELFSSPDTYYSFNICHQGFEQVFRGQSLFKKVKIINSDNIEIDCELRLVSLPSETNRRLIRGSFIDITDRIATEIELNKIKNQLNQAQKMESFGRMGSMIAHDFNNYLTVITGYSKLLSTELNDVVLLDFLENIEEAALKASNLTKQLLSFSRKRILNKKVVNMRDLLQKVSNFIRGFLPENIELILIMQEKLHAIEIDPVQFEQVIMNLAINSQSAMQDGGLISIKAKNFIHNTYEMHECIKIEVVDNGYGMDELTREQVFEPFFTTKPEGEGTGLGLSTAYGIITQSGGTIEVKSILGVGTTFTILLPASKSKEIKEIIKEQNLIVVNEDLDKTILVVDDESSVSGLVKEILNRIGYNIISVNEPLKAIDFVKLYKGKIDLLLTDIVMPKMNGLELSIKIKDIIGDKLKVLFMTGYSKLEIIHKIKESGYEILEKPFSPEKLHEKIKNIF